MLRYTVYDGQKPFVALSREIAYIQNYLALQRIRLDDKCQFDIRLKGDSQRWSIPPLLLIVLVENAFKHGIEKLHTQSYITLSITLEENQLLMLCENAFLPEHEDSKTGGMGLENLRRRLELLYPGNFELHSAPDEQTWRAHLQIELTPC